MPHLSSSSLRVRPSAWVALAAILAVALSLLQSPGRASGAVVEPDAESATPNATRSVTSVHRVTLITGDTVRVTQFADGRTAVAADPNEPAGRDGLRTVSVDGDVYMFPASAMPFVASGAVDRQLFNVTGLIAQGLADDQRRTLPVIVQYATNAAAQRDEVPSGGVQTRTLTSINAVAVSAAKYRAADFWKGLTGKPATSVVRRPEPQLLDGVEKVWLDGRVEAALADSVAQIGAPAVWDAGYDGTGVTVAVLDSGIDSAHPDLTGQVDGTQSFVPGETIKDVLGHGTHVASTIAGTGTASDGVERGVAPGAHLLVGKVLGDDGFGQDSWIIDGMEWAAAHADIVSMSLGTDEPSDGTDPMSQSLNALSEGTGALFVVAVGNRSAEQSIGSPGAADDALTVSAVDGSDALAWFASQGPRLGDMALKPDLVAPGVDILAARSQYAPDGDGYYTTMSGTSMATPHVAGLAALLAERHPAWTGQRLKDTLMSTTVRLDGTTPYQVGTGRIDAEGAVLGHVAATGSVFFGFDRWPHPDESAVTRTVTFRNDSAAAVDLTLGLDVQDSGGGTPPSGMFTLSSPSVAVPAHGTQSVGVTVDPAAGEDGQRYLGQLLARSGGTVVTHTSVGFVKEDERYDLTIRVVDRNGAPAKGYVDLVGGPAGYDTVFVDGSATLRLPPATYAVSTWQDVDADTDHAGVALLTRPQISLTNDRSVVLDARTARPITVAVPRARSMASASVMTWYRNLDGIQVGGQYMAPVWVDHLYATPTSPVSDGSFDFSTRWRVRQPLLSIDAFGDPLDVLPQVGSPLFTGRAHMRAVVAGNGAPDDYTGLDATGKVAIVTRSDSVSPFERAVAAHAAGARLLLVVNDRPTELREWTGSPDWTEAAPLPVASISGTEGARLIGGGNPPSSLLVIGHPNTAWVYDLQAPHEGRIPTSLTFAPGPSQLALVRGEYAADRPTAAGEFRYDFRPYMTSSTGFMESLTLPRVRREWVSTEPGTSWYQEVLQFEPAWDQRGVREAYQPGQHLTTRWFSPVVRPRLGEGYWKPNRAGGWMSINLPAWADSGRGHTGDMYYATGTSQEVSLFAHGRLIKRGHDQAIWVEAPSAGKVRYLLTTVATRDPATWRTSTRTSTRWWFWSRKPRDGVSDLPLLSVDYRVATDLAGRVGPGSTPIGISVVPVNGADLGGSVSGARLAASFDGGQTWRRVSLTSTGSASWRGTIPRLRSSVGAVALRATAWDSGGNRVTQIVIGAYRLR